MKSLRLFILTSAFLLVSTGVLSARAMRNWSNQELLDKSDLVVIASPTASATTGELTNLPDVTGVSVIGVESKFVVSAVVKGDTAIKDFVLHHYKEANGGIPDNGPLLVSFDTGKRQSFLLYLVREADGRYAPATGQADPRSQAVRAIQETLPNTVASTPEPGPENGGLRMRLVVVPNSAGGQEGYEVRLDVLNVTNRPVKLRAGWWQDQERGDVRDYIEASTSIETYPAIAPWMGQVMAAHRTAAQPETVLKAGAVLTLHWQTNGRHLKNRVSNPLEAQNPELLLPGLYSVHATVAIITSERTVQLRSNEQLVSSGRSHEMPKHSYGELLDASAERKTGRLNLGSLQKIERGDQFQVGHPYRGLWKLTITEVDNTVSVGSFEPLPPVVPPPANYHPPFPERNQPATLMPQK